MWTKIWLMVTLLLSWPLSAQTATLSDTDFEDCTPGAADGWVCDSWRSFNGSTTGHLSASTEQAITGAKSIKGTWDNVTGSSFQPSMYFTLNGSTHFFTRFAAYMVSGFKVGSNNLTKLFRVTTAKASTSSTAPAFMYPTLHVMFEGSPPHWIVAMESVYTSPVQAGGSGVRGAGGTPFWRNGPNVTQNGWDNVELEIQLNTPGQQNGLMNLWINGILSISQSGMEYVGPTATSRNGQGYLDSSTWTPDTAQFFVQSGLGSIYLDRVAFCSTRCGPITGGPPPPPQDTTPPSAPTCAQIGTPCP